MALTVNIRLLPNPVGKIAMTSRPASSSFTAVFCSLLRIIFSFSRLTLRRSSALSMVDSADSAIIFRNSLPSTPLGNMRKIMRRIIYYDWHMYSPRPISFPAHWCAGYSKYRGFLAGSISNASSPLIFFGSRQSLFSFQKCVSLCLSLQFVLCFFMLRWPKYTSIYYLGFTWPTKNSILQHSLATFCLFFLYINIAIYLLNTLVNDSLYMPLYVKI